MLHTVSRGNDTALLRDVVPVALVARASTGNPLFVAGAISVPLAAVPAAVESIGLIDLGLYNGLISHDKSVLDAVMQVSLGDSTGLFALLSALSFTAAVRPLALSSAPSLSTNEAELCCRGLPHRADRARLAPTTTLELSEFSTLWHSAASRSLWPWLQQRPPSLRELQHQQQLQLLRMRARALPAAERARVHASADDERHSHPQ